MEPTTSTYIWNERFRLARLDKDDFIRIGLWSVVFALFFIAYHLLGNTADLKNYSRSVLGWMWRRWVDEGSFDDGGDYSHGVLIPIVSFGIVYWKREEFLRAPKNINYLGLAIFVFSMFLHWVGAKAQHPRLSLIGMIGLLYGIPLYLYGWQVAKLLIFPCAYLLFCVPLNFLGFITFPLQMLMTNMSAALLEGLQIMVNKNGTILTSPTGDFEFNVEAPCSGLRSLLAMTALTAVYAFLTQHGLVKKWVLFLAAIPLAVVGNMVRITSIALVAVAYNKDFAAGPYHDWSGYLVFAVVIGLMVTLGTILNTNWKARFQLWKQNLISPSL